MNIILKPQEESTNSKFDGQLYLTQNFINTFKEKAHLIAMQAVLKIQVERVTYGADYFQSLECNGIKFWVIDDVDHVTALMPEDY